MSKIVYDHNYVRVIDHVVDDKWCDQMVEAFELCKDYQVEIPGRLWELDCYNVRANPRAIFKPKGLTRNSNLVYNWTPDTDRLMTIVNDLFNDFRTRWDPHAFLPVKYAAEGFRIKAYDPGEHMFKLHVDQGCRDTATRFLAFLIYLNDNEAGTEFINELDDKGNPLVVRAKKGRVCVFTPTWHYPHIGHMPHTNKKYIMSTYLHYIPKGA